MFFKRPILVDTRQGCKKSQEDTKSCACKAIIEFGYRRI